MAKSGKNNSKKGDDAEGKLIENRRARHDYHILETLECGIMLRGSEVKSVRNGEVSLGEGFVRVESAGKSRTAPTEMWLHGVNIGHYGPSGPPGSPLQHKAIRARKLLAHRREIDKLRKHVEVKGMTIVPLKMYFKSGLAKVLIGLAKGKAAHDKRQDIAKRDMKREMDRAMSRRA